MVATPLQIFTPILIGVLTLILLITAGILLLVARRTPMVLVRRDDRVADGRVADDRGEYVPVPAPHARRRRQTLTAIALAIILLTAFGRMVVSAMRPSGDAPQKEFGQVTRRVTGPTGAELAVEESGPADAPRIVLTHGWGADRREWSYARKRLERQFRVIAWDLPGLGQSKPIPSGDYSLVNMAADLRAVVDATGTQPAILVGHSIGGMINLTVCQQNGGGAGANVNGIVQLNTSYTNPVKTMKGHELHEKLQKPLYEPLLNVIPAVSPVVRGLNWLGYQSGLLHLQTASSSFAGAETREQVDFASRYYYQSSPAVVARGALGMLHWDASDVLERISVPVLIVSGEQDTTTLPSASDRMSERIPRDSRVSVSPAAHLGPIEQHERYNLAIETFALAQLRGQGQEITLAGR